MSNVDFLYIPASSSESDAFKIMRQKHVRESSKFDNNFYLTQIFTYLSAVYNSITADDQSLAFLSFSKIVYRFHPSTPSKKE